MLRHSRPLPWSVVFAGLRECRDWRLRRRDHREHGLGPEGQPRRRRVSADRAHQPSKDGRQVSGGLAERFHCPKDPTGHECTWVWMQSVCVDAVSL